MSKLETTQHVKYTKGRVVSDKMSNSIVILVESLFLHKKFKKHIKKSKKIMVHDPENKAKIGDFVLVRQSKPFSKRKRHILHGVIEAS